MLRSWILAGSLSLLAAGAAAAQQPQMPRAAMMPPSPSQGAGVRVQVHVSLVVPGAIDDTEASLQSQERTRRALYETAARECEVLRATIASDCRIESINVNMNRGYSGPQVQGFTATGNFGYRVTLK